MIFLLLNNCKDGNSKILFSSLLEYSNLTKKKRTHKNRNFIKTKNKKKKILFLLFSIKSHTHIEIQFLILKLYVYNIIQRVMNCVCASKWLAAEIKNKSFSGFIFQFMCL